MVLQTGSRVKVAGQGFGQDGGQGAADDIAVRVVLRPADLSPGLVRNQGGGAEVVGLIVNWEW